jgi:hypothetical protein
MLLPLAELYAATGRRVYRESLMRLLGSSPAEADPHSAGLAASASGEARQALAAPDAGSRFQRDLAGLATGIASDRPVRAIRGAAETYLYRGLSYADPAAVPAAVWNAALERRSDLDADIVRFIVQSASALLVLRH